MNKRLSNASKTSKHWDCWFVSELVSCLSLTNSPQRHLVDPDFASCRSDSCSCIGQKKISGSLLQRPMVLVECIHFIVTLIAPIFSGTKILKLQFYRGVYSTLRFSNVQQTNSVHLVFTGWGCKWLTKVLEWCFYFFFFFPYIQCFHFRVSGGCCCLYELYEAQFCSQPCTLQKCGRSCMMEVSGSRASSLLTHHICRRAKLVICALFSAFSFPFLFLLKGAIKQLLC